MHLHSAGNGPHGPRANAESARGINSSAAQLGMRSKPQIIIRTEIDDFLPVEIRGRLLLAFQDFQIEVKMLRFQVFDRLMQILKLGTCATAHDSSGGLVARYLPAPLG